MRAVSIVVLVAGVVMVIWGAWAILGNVFGPAAGSGSAFIAALIGIATVIIGLLLAGVGALGAGKKK